MEDKTKALLEDYGAVPVPEKEQKGWLKIGIIFWGIAVCLPAFLVSGMVAGPARLGFSIGVFIVAALILGLIAILTGIIGANTKLSTGLSARYTFGLFGANVFQIALFFGAWGWFGVQLGFMVAGLGDGGLQMVLGGAMPVWSLKIIGGVLMTLTAMFGFKAIEKLSLVSIPLLLIIIIATIVSVYGGETTLATVSRITGEGAMPFGVAVSVVIGSFIVGALIAPDVTRYAKSKAAGGWGMAFGMIIGFPLVLILGGIMVKGAGGEVDFSKVMIENNAGFWVVLAIITIILAAWTTNDNNLYSGALSLNAMFPKLKKWIITVASGGIGTVLALLGINTSGGFQMFLTYLAILIPPAAAVMVVDYFFFRSERNKEYKAEEIENVPKFRVIPFVSWMVGTAFGFVIQYTALQLTSVTALDTIIVGAIVYFIIMFATRKRVSVEV
ncbi:MAG: cytosine permease [Spirochaetales bacterium]|nr:cytosine permease [Spirochaetales bacterium]MCF7937912.1 cytosine permease [Spirochaetales bacterium]